MAPRPAMVMGIETEYGIYARKRLFPYSESEYIKILDASNDEITKAVRSDIGCMGRQLEIDKEVRIPTFQHLANGGRFYIDCKHPEMATPECPTPRDVVIWDSAGERIVYEAAQRASKRLHYEVTIVKKLTDGLNHTWGCHENYCVNPQFFSRIVKEDEVASEQRTLATWLAVRQLLVGAGKIGSDNGRNPSAPSVFQLSQRSDFIVAYRGVETTSQRPLIQVRDEPHANSNEWKRLHVICGDANLCQWSTYLKMSLTGLLLLMWQDRSLKHRPPLPVVWRSSHHDAMHFISNESDLVARYPVRVLPGRGQLGGIKHMTAAEILSFYVDAMAWYAHERSWSSPAEASAYQVAAEKAQWMASFLRAGDWQSLYGWLDWPTKRGIVQEYLRRKGKTWLDVLQDEELFSRVRIFGDQVYTTLDPNVSFYQRLLNEGVIRTVVKGSEIARAVLHPPTGRASQRSLAVEAYPTFLRDGSWSTLLFQQPPFKLSLTLNDPMGVPDEQFRAILDASPTPVDLYERLKTHPLPHVHMKREEG